MPEIFSDPTFWVAVALGIFVVITIYLRVPGTVARQLDARADAIRGELDEAKRLRTEAEDVLKQYEAKRRDAEVEAQQIVAAAKAEADRLAQDAKAQLQAYIERRKKAAEQKITQAESAAIAEVRAAAASAAINAAEVVLKAQMTEAKADAIADAALRDVRAKLH